MYIIFIEIGCFVWLTGQTNPCLDDTVDLVFVLDSSGSIRDNNPDDDSYDNYQLLLNFVISIVNELPIGQDETRVGVVVFSNLAESVIYLNDHNDKASLVAAISNIEYIGGNTNTSGGLLLMRTEQFTAGNGDRESVPNIAIVITDGVSTFDRNRTIPEANAAKRDGVQIYSVGITTEIDETELRLISSSPQLLNQNYFTSPDFTILNDIVSQLLNEACPPAIVYTAPEPNIDFCFATKIDLVFVIDSSGSIRDANPADGLYDNWQLILDYVIAIVDTIVVGEDKARIGLVSYSTFATNEFFLDTYKTRYEVKEAIRNVAYIGSFTNTSGAIRTMRKEQFRRRHGDRSNAENIAIIITDGASTIEADSVIDEARKARKDDVTIYSIGITDAVNVEEVKKMSSQPQRRDQNYFLTPDFESFSGLKIKLDCDGKLIHQIHYYATG